MPEIILILHNIRSAHNVGAMFRTAEGFGVTRIICSGYTPHPGTPHDSRLPHQIEKISSQIHKTALGSELLVPFEYYEIPPLEQLRHDGYRIVALEQDRRSITLSSYTSPSRLVLLVGEEVYGVAEEHRQLCDDIIEIPMFGEKESFNVSVAAGIALYALAAANVTT